LPETATKLPFSGTVVAVSGNNFSPFSATLLPVWTGLNGSSILASKSKWTKSRRRLFVADTGDKKSTATFCPLRLDETL